MIPRIAPPDTDALLGTLGAALKTIWAPARSARPTPGPTPGSGCADGTASAQTEIETLSADEKREAAALMRVNHCGEVCAQALYTAQALATQDPVLRAHLLKASEEETDHLAWTEQRLHELGSHKSLLNPLWYAGAFGIGLLAGKLAGDRVSLGFVVETERQVEAHLQGHLERLPAADHASRAIVAQMKKDEVAHAEAALRRGAIDLPAPVKGLMKLAGGVMTSVAHRV